MDTRWSEGVWLGHNRGSNESRVERVLCGDAQRVMKTWAFRRRVPSEIWSNELITNMKGSPQDFRQGVGEHEDDIQEWTEADIKEPTDSKDEARSPPKMYLRKRDYKQVRVHKRVPWLHTTCTQSFGTIPPQ